MREGSKIKILLVEDNLADAKLTSKLFARCEGVDASDIKIAEDGEEAWGILNSEVNKIAVQKINLVFLDLNIPKINGLELLKMIREDDTFSYLPVVILSSSIAETDLQAAHQLNVSAYLKKPVDLVEYQGLMKKIEGFWFKSCHLPEC